MLDTGWLDVYLGRIEELSDSDPAHQVAVSAVGKMMAALGREGIIQELEKLPPEGEGDDVQERRRRGLSVGLQGLDQVGSLLIEGH